MSQRDIDEMGPEIEGWIRHLVKNKARFNDPQMDRLATESGRISAIRDRADEITKGQGIPATEWDKTMAPIVIDAIDTQREILTRTKNGMRQARIENMRNDSAHLDREMLDDKAS